MVTCTTARDGQAGQGRLAGHAAIGSFSPETVCTILIAWPAAPGPDPFQFAAPEYFSLMVLGLVASAVLAQGSLLKAIAAIVLGLLIGLVGVDVNSGVSRYTFGTVGLSDGLSFVVLAMGLFSFAEILSNLGSGKETANRQLLTDRIHNLMPRWPDIRQSIGAIVRGTAIGAFFGTLPGAGPTIGAFSSYAVEKKLARDPSQIGKGRSRGSRDRIGEQRRGPVRLHPHPDPGDPGSGTMR